MFDQFWKSETNDTLKIWKSYGGIVCIQPKLPKIHNFVNSYEYQGVISANKLDIHCWLPQCQLSKYGVTPYTDATVFIHIGDGIVTRPGKVHM